jgi:hypothetical protein
MYAVGRDGKRLPVKEARRRNKLAEHARKRVRDEKGRFGSRVVRVLAHVRIRDALRAPHPDADEEDYIGTNEYELRVWTEDHDDWRKVLDETYPELVHFDIAEAEGDEE